MQRNVLCLGVIALSALFCGSRAVTAAADRLPGKELNPVLAAPITTWDEAIPLGNGLLGGLLWGQGQTVRLSLDRGDLWDERPREGIRWKDFNYETMVRLVREGKNNEINAIFDYPYNGLYPTKIPAGRLEIGLPAAQDLKKFELNLASAEGRAWLANGAKIDAFLSATSPVALVRIPGAEPASIRLHAPQSVKQLGYPPPQPGSEGSVQWFVQQAAQGLRYCVACGSRRSGDATLLAVTVTSTRDGPAPVAIARQRIDAALGAGYEEMLRAHAAWWRQFWSQSQVFVPESEILRHYYLVQYFYGAASRRGAPPMPLQGVWTADAGGLPPWKGDYHNDLNTQMTYIAYQAAGRFEEGRCFLDMLWDLLPVFRRFAKDFYAAPGAAVPGVMTLAGQPLGGWGHYSLSPTMGAWNAHLFYLHWRYCGDEQFLKERAYPWCREIGQCLRHLLKPDSRGTLGLPVSTSPEIYDNSMRAWLEPNSNYDLACLKMLFLALAEMARACGDAAEADQWIQTAGALGEFHVGADHMLKLDAKLDLPASHRHLSNLMPVHPFNLITVDGGPGDRGVIAASLKQWDRLGTGAWCGYSFSWMSCLRARVGDSEAAVRNLDIFVKAFILRNGFHVNGDQTGSGFSGFTYRPFTLEGNFLAAQALHEMLLQTWSGKPGSGEDGVVRLFPAMPWRWHEASFDDLRAEGGHRVSARRENNATTWLRVAAGRDGPVRIRDNFGGTSPTWSRADVKKSGGNFEVLLKRGEAVEATMLRPAAVPARPANLAEPVVIDKSAVRPNKLPLRIGADSQGGNRFQGDLMSVCVFNRALGGDEIRQLADRRFTGAAKIKGCVVAIQGSEQAVGSCTNAAEPRVRAKAHGAVSLVEAGEGISGKALCLDGGAFLEIAYDESLDCPEGLTVAAWVRPRALPPSGARIVDKSPVGVASAYLFDTYPGDSLRLITKDPHLIHAAKLPLGKWTHVAGTVDGSTGRRALYVNGRHVAEDRR